MSITAWGFSALATFYAILLTQRDAEWVKISILDKLVVEPPFGIWLFGFFLVVAAMSHILLHNFPTPPMFDAAPNTNPHYDTFSQLATTGDLRRELEGEAAEKVNIAEAYFKAAFHDYEKKRFSDAVKNCEKSLEAIPSITAYINLSGFLTYTTEYKKTEEAFLKGIQFAQMKEDKKSESILLSNRSSYYSERGLGDKALLDINKSIELDANNSNAHFNLAAHYCDTLLYDKADKELEKSKAKGT